MKLTDVRRLTGRNCLMAGIGAAAEAAVSDELVGPAIALWRREARGLLAAVGWSQETIHVRPYPGGASLAVTAPLDGLYAATDLIEAAWSQVEHCLNGTQPSDRDKLLGDLQRAIAEEARPGLVPLAEAATRRGISAIHGEGELLLGLGKTSQRFSDQALPAPEALDWDSLRDIPVAMVTGTNGKSTSVRLMAAVGQAAGLTVGVSSSDWARVGREILDEGDYSGPGGARLALRDSRTELAVLETARGGLLRRGLVVPWADAALITNVALDHMGQYGITDLAALVDAKFTVARAVRPGGRLVLNGDDPNLQRASARFGGEITWFTLNEDAPWLAPWLNGGGRAVFPSKGALVLAQGTDRHAVIAVADIPIALGGAARFNIANALGVIGLADALGLAPAAMVEGLSGFQATPEENPGRGNFMDLGGVAVLVDFAHNPHGLSALVEAIKGLPAKRRLYLLGQAGDRRDEDIRDLVRIVWATRPERIIVKEMESTLRGRDAGEVPALISAELEALGASSGIVSNADSELEAVRQALTWARDGDLLVLLLHSERKAALGLFDALRAQDWRPGQDLPS